MKEDANSTDDVAMLSGPVSGICGKALLASAWATSRELAIRWGARQSANADMSRKAQIRPMLMGKFGPNRDGLVA